MDILFASDLHVSRNHLKRLLSLGEEKRVDAIVIGGDLVPREGYHETIEEMVEYQRRYLKETFVPLIEQFKKRNPGVSLFLDMGNDDFAANRDVLEERDGDLFHLLHMKVHPLTDEVDVAGYMCVPPTPFSLKDWEKADTENHPVSSPQVTISGVFTKGGVRFGDLKIDGKETIEKDLKKLSKKIKKPFLFVSHTPPYGTDLDIVYGGDSHVGSRAVAAFLEEWSSKGLLLASFHGHIHEAPEVSGINCVRYGDAVSYNPGQSPHELKYLIFGLTE